MNQLRMVGEIPFHPEHSSNSTRKPKNFSWHTEFGVCDVWIDNGIIQGANEPYHSRKYGWFLESRAIKPQLFMWLQQNYESVLNQYEGIFTCDKELVKLDPMRFILSPPGSCLPWVNPTEYAIYNKTKLCSMIASAKQMSPGHLLRHQVAQKMLDAGVHVVGGACGTPKIGLDSGRIHPNKISALGDFMFHVVVENCQYDNYFTEKLTDCFATGTVPIYLGCPSIGEHFNTDGMLFLDEEGNFDISSLNADRYYGMMPAIEDNLNRVRKLQGADDFIWQTIGNS
tara:strand:+ start:404 stop:1255 length:852 start_codon:yes stop_codon:yes gene_type:complete